MNSRQKQKQIKMKQKDYLEIIKRHDDYNSVYKNLKIVKQAKVKQQALLSSLSFDAGDVNQGVQPRAGLDFIDRTSNNDCERLSVHNRLQSSHQVRLQVTPNVMASPRNRDQVKPINEIYHPLKQPMKSILKKPKTQSSLQYENDLINTMQQFSIEEKQHYSEIDDLIFDENTCDCCECTSPRDVNSNYQNRTSSSTSRSVLGNSYMPYLARRSCKQANIANDQNTITRVNRELNKYNRPHNSSSLNNYKIDKVAYHRPNESFITYDVPTERNKLNKEKVVDVGTYLSNKLLGLSKSINVNNGDARLVDKTREMTKSSKITKQKTRRIVPQHEKNVSSFYDTNDDEDFLY